MSTVAEIEKAIDELPSEDMRKLLAWINEKQDMNSCRPTEPLGKRSGGKL